MDYSDKRAVLNPNAGKKIQININGKKYLRYPVRTALFKKGDDYVSKITIESLKNFSEYKAGKKKFLLIVSEKIIAISQGRSFFIRDIKPSIMARILSTFVKRTPYGIGLGSPWTMQLAIQEIGLAKILFATVASALTKPFGISGVFYKIAGETVRSIDGPTEYSLYPSNVSAKLGPKDPEMVATEIHKSVKNKLEKSRNTAISNFLGAVVIDANDLGRDVLGNSTKLSNRLIEKIMSDNPMGQGNEQTPLVVCFLV